jgi:arginyl-tRNA synthetase
LDRRDQIKIIKLLARWPEVIAAAVKSSAPHLTTHYLSELAIAIHRLWNTEDAAGAPVDENDAAKVIARLALAEGVRIVLEAGLGLLGLDTAETVL